MHVSGGFSEGLLMSGYFLTMQIYMAPLLSRVPQKIYVYCGTILLMFTIFTFGPDMMSNCSPDILMATIYGCSLLFVFEKNSYKLFDCISIAVILSVLVLTKSIGIQWTIFTITFMIGLNIYRKNKATFHEIICILLPLCTWYSWYLFCKFYERTTYLTENMKYGAEVGFFNSDLFLTYGKELFFSFFKALFMKQQSGIFGIGFSIIACILLFILILRFFYLYNFLDTADYNWLIIFIIGSSIVEYGILLFSVETMFIPEYGLYTDTSNMLLLIKRYGSPFIVGSSYLLIFILFTFHTNAFKSQEIVLRKNFTIRVWLFIIGFSIISAPWDTLWKKYVSYRSNPTQLEQSISERIPEFENLISSINKIENSHRQKLLLFVDEDVDIPISISYYAAPVSIVVEKCRTDQPDLWKDAIQYYGCTSICFVSNQSKWTILDNIFLENGEQAALYTLYYVKNNMENEFQLSEHCE